jgi:hypothetical protein
VKTRRSSKKEAAQEKSAFYVLPTGVLKNSRPDTDYRFTLFWCQGGFSFFHRRGATFLFGFFVVQVFAAVVGF